MKYLTLLAAVALLGAGTAHENLSLPATENMQVTVPWGRVVLRADDQTSKVHVRADYGSPMNVDRGSRDGVMKFAVSPRGTSAASDRLEIEYPASMQVRAQNERGDISLHLPANYTKPIAVHSAHLLIDGSAHITSDRRAAAILRAPSGTVTIAIKHGVSAPATAQPLVCGRDLYAEYVSRCSRRR